MPALETTEDIAGAISIQRTSPISIHLQVVKQIEQLIGSEVLPANSRLPAGRELAKKLGVNRNTIQKAYQELQEKGFLRATKGSGTYVVKAAAEEGVRRSRDKAEAELRRILSNLAQEITVPELAAIVNSELARLAVDRERATLDLIESRAKFANWRGARR